MNIFFDENIPYANEFFSGLGSLYPFRGRELSAKQVQEADVLLVRSITKVNKELLSLNSRLQFVGTATIGEDHIDKDYLSKQGVTYTNSPGCNAISVAEYVLSALIVLAQRYHFDITEMTVGIIGAGNTGSRLSEKLQAFGVNYKLCDPLLEQTNDNRDFCSLEQALACDVISLHVPLTRDGQYPTFHLLNSQRLNQLSSKQVLINACRGEVVDNQALLNMKRSGHALKLVLDVWENEPNPLTELIPYCDIATAHIAGYSLEGKARGTEMLYQALTAYLGQKSSLALKDFLPKLAVDTVQVSTTIDNELLSRLALLIYDVRRDDGIFRQQLAEFGFDSLRKNYPVRREFSALNLKSEPQHSLSSAVDLGFSYK